MDSQSLGKLGERLALLFMAKKGYTLAYSRFRTKNGEVDLVMNKGNIYSFIEVKTRATSFSAASHDQYSLQSHPELAVNDVKQGKFVVVVRQYIERYRLYDHHIQCDVVSVLVDVDTHTYSLRYFPSAFS